MNSSSETATKLNMAAAELQWPEPEPQDLDPELDDETIKAIWAELDWDQDGVLGRGALNGLQAAVGSKQPTEVLDEIFTELETNLEGLFDASTFSLWLNGETEHAKTIRRAARSGSRLSLRDGMAMAGMASRLGMVGLAGTGTAAKAMGKGLATGWTAFRSGAAAAAKPTAKASFAVTKVSLTATAKITGVGGVLMERVEKMTLDPDLTEAQTEALLAEMDGDENGKLFARSAVIIIIGDWLSAQPPA